MNNPFTATNHYRLIDGFLDSRKDFIVLGLCGKTGSGSTTVAKILQKSFDQLNLPVPADSAADSIEEHEYRILYTYAKAHWNPFYRIKTSALITAHVLNESVEDFLLFLDEFLPAPPEPRNRAALAYIAGNFFDAEMCFDLNQWIQIDPADREIACSWLESDQYPTQKDKKTPVRFTPATSGQSADKALECTDHTLNLVGDRPLSIQFRFDKASARSLFKTRDLYRLFWEYQQRRQEKKGFDNPLLIFLLQQFIYDDLPVKCARLWDNLANIIPDVQVAALQQLGNHLRISGQPYGTSFDPKAYTTIVVDINTAIKLLSASLAWQKKWIEEEHLQKQQEQKQIKRSLVVVDSIKNPFESMYLKDRYTNYYLLGIYTEDRLRWEWLRRDQHFSDDHIQAIDIIEQMKEFKRQYNSVLKAAKDFRKRLPLSDIEHSLETLIAELARFCPEETAKLREKWAAFCGLPLMLPQDYHRILKDIQTILGQVTSASQTKDGTDAAETWQRQYQSWQAQADRAVEEADALNHLSPVVIDTIRTIDSRQLLDELPFILQNVGSCLENADIFINNEPDSKRHLLLKWKLIRYVSLIMNPGLVLPSPVERCMQLAYTAKLNSGCISRQVGAAITDAEYHLLSIGWNQQPEGQVPCSYRDLCSLYNHWSPEAYSDYECDDQDQIQERIKGPVTELLDTPECPLKIQGKLPAYCFKDIYNSIMGGNNQVHPRSLHAEETAFLNLGQYSARGGILFTTSSPCELCAKKAKYEGISKIYYIEPYSGISLKHVLNIGPKASRPQMLLFTGATGRAYTQLYTPLLPKKDELAFWLGAKVDVKLLDHIREKEGRTASAATEQKEETHERT